MNSIVKIMLLFSLAAMLSLGGYSLYNVIFGEKNETSTDTKLSSVLPSPFPQSETMPSAPPEVNDAYIFDSKTTTPTPTTVLKISTPTPTGKITPNVKATSTPTPKPKNTSIPTPNQNASELPSAGISFPTIITISIGIIFLLPMLII